MSSSQEASVNFGPYSLRGHVVIRNSQFDGAFEVRLVRDLNREIASVYVHSLEWFRFKGLSAGPYFVVIQTPGFKDLRQRVDVDDLRRDQSLVIFLEPKDVEVRGPDYSLNELEDNIIDVHELLSSVLRSEYDRALEDFKSGDYDAARQRFEQIVQSSPGSYDPHKYLGMVYRELSLFQKAEAEYEAARKIRPTSIVPLLLLGDVYLLHVTGDSKVDVSTKRLLLARAVESLTEAVQIDPNEGLGYYLLGLVYLEATFYEDAEDNLLRALELEPGLSRANLALANVYIRMREWQNALARIDTFLSSNHDSASRELLEVRSEVEAAAKSSKE